MNINRNTVKQTYEKARANLKLMLVFTFINIVLLLVGSETMLLFAATVPYLSVIFASAIEIVEMRVLGIVIAAVVMALYLVCCIFSKKSPVWMIVALVMFVIDTIALIFMYVAIGEYSGILDFAIHIWVLYYLVIGVINGYKLRKLGPEDENAEESDEICLDEEANTQPRYFADATDKYRVLAEFNIDGYRVCYRRIKRTNELVINDYVYDCVEMLFETPHNLSASVGGHLFEAGYSGSHSYIRVDGELLVKKIRIW